MHSEFAFKEKDWGPAQQSTTTAVAKVISVSMWKVNPIICASTELTD